MSSQLNRTIVLKPPQTIIKRINEVDISASDTATELTDPTERLFSIFPEQPLLEHLHIIVDPGPIADDVVDPTALLRGT
jgi:hypothetical protein